MGFTRVNFLNTFQLAAASGEGGADYADTNLMTGKEALRLMGYV